MSKKSFEINLYNSILPRLITSKKTKIKEMKTIKNNYSF